MNFYESFFRRVAARLRPVRALWFLPIFAFMALQCRLSTEEKGDTLISFSHIYDSLKQYDEVVIVLKNLNGDTLDVIFQGKVEHVGDVQKLRAPHWDGGRVIVSITGTKDGVVAYQVETRFDPANGERDNIVVFVAPDESITSTVKSLALYTGESVPLPPIVLLPENLKDKSLEWASNPAGLVSFTSASLTGLQAGKGDVSVHLKNNPSVSLSIPVEVFATSVVPESVSVRPESLKVAVGGAEWVLTAQVSPSGAPAGVNWSSEDTSIARVDTSGRVKGVHKGETRIWAASRLKSSIKGYAFVKVTDSIPVETVAFAKDSLEILVGAAAESLIVSVLPMGANPAVTFTLSDTTKASIRNGKITGKAAGRITVTAASVSNPAAQDNLIVRITVPVPDDTTPPNKPTVTVKPAGPTQERRPVWTWKSGGNGGAGAYQISLDKANFDTSAISLSDTTYTPAADLAAGLHVLYVRERDASNNWSEAGSAQVDIDITGPAAPKIYGTSPTSSLPRWTWSTGGNGGAGLFRSRLGDATFPANAPESRDTIYALTTAVSGTTYTLYVEERDLAGNWSAAGSLAIKYDLTKPTVAITAPQASGTFITALDTVTLAGTATGPNRIAKVEYVLDAGVASPITLGTGGSWTLAALKVANAKTTTVKVTATDSLGNTGEAQLQVLRDSDIPLPPTALVKPSSPTNVAQSAWAWSAGGDGAAGSGLSGKYRWKLNAGTWTETSAASAPVAPLAEGSNTFSVEEQDKAGNWSDPLTGTVVLDTKVPDAVTFVGVDASFTADDTPTWSWKPSTTNGGIGKYFAKLDAGTEFDLDTATTYTPVTPLSDNATHTLTVREKDQVPGVAGTAKGFSYKIKVNPPGAPVVKSAVASLPNNGSTNNPGFSWNSGGGGNGKYRVKVNTEATYRVNGAAQTTFSLVAGDPDGTYTLYVSEQDDLGRWGAEGSLTINLDRTGPVYTAVQIKGSTFDLREGYITNLPALTISYKADGIGKEMICDLSKDNASNACSATNTDAVGNSSTLLRNVWRRSNTVFFKPTASGAMDGSSWENAKGDVTGYINNTVDTDVNGKDLWLASGDYSSQSFFITLKWVNVYGGFNATTFPTDTSNRTENNTIVGHVTFYGGVGGTWSGIRFAGGIGFVATVTLQNCQSFGPISIQPGSDVTMNNVELTGYRDEVSPVLSVDSNSKLTWDGGKIVDNVVTDAVPIQLNDGSTVTLTGPLVVSGNASPSYPGSQIQNQGSLSISSSVSITCSTIINTGGTGSCKGAPLP